MTRPDVQLDNIFDIQVDEIGNVQVDEIGDIPDIAKCVGISEKIFQE